PDPVEALIRKGIERRIINVGERDGLPGLTREVVQPDPRVDLKKRRVLRHRPPSLDPLLFSTERRFPSAVQKAFRVELAKNLDKQGDNTGPTRLVAGPNAGAIVPMEVFVE